MKKYIVLSSNDTPKYLFYAPLVCWAWKKFDWEPVLFFHLNDDSENGHLRFNVVSHFLDDVYFYPLADCSGFKSETITQVSRLYAGTVINKGLIMTSDVDMMPLSDYWHPSETEFTSYGRDLTDYHYPICYLAGPANHWRRVMDYRLSDSISPYDWAIEQDLDLWSSKYKDTWTLDQQIITERLLSYGKHKIEKVDRGTDRRTGYPVGRVDRSAWHLSHHQFIDAHLPHDILTNEKSYRNVMELLRKIWPSEDFGWFEQYYRDFKRLL